MATFNEFCKSKNCPQCIEWTFGMGSNCVSCKLIGQSYDIDEYPKDCLFLEDIKEFEKINDHRTSL